MTNGKLIERIADFINDKRKSERGGWAEVREKDMTELDEILDGIISSKWEQDADGDLPINCKLIDRTKFEPDHFFVLPYLDHNSYREKSWPEQQKAMLEYIDLAGANIDIAAKRLEIALKLLRSRRQHEERRQSQEK
jgi:hypothetical protein